MCFCWKNGIPYICPISCPRLRVGPTAVGDGKQKRRKSNWRRERESPPSLSGALLRRGVPHSVPNSKRDLGCVNLPPNLRGCRCTALQAARGECADDFSLLSWKRLTPTRATTAAANSHQEEEEAWKEDGPATAALIVLRSVGKTIFRFAVVNSSHFYAGNRDVRFSG